MLELREWSFIPGPLTRPPESSLELHDLVGYAPESVAEAFLSYPGMQLLHPADPSWWEWKARWGRDERFIELDMSLFETEPVTWGGSTITAHCSLDDLMRLWEAVRTRCQAVWLHNGDCEIHTPDSLRRLFVV
jgi:hypothetical protein